MRAPDRVYLTWLGCAGLLLEAESGMPAAGSGSQTLRIAVDPFARVAGSSDQSGNPSNDLSGLVSDADACLVTHGHFDHIMSIPGLFGDRIGAGSTGITSSTVRADCTVVYCTKTPAATLHKHGLPEAQMHVLHAGDSFELHAQQDAGADAGSIDADSAGPAVSVKTFPSRHCRFDMPLVLRTAFSKRLLTDLTGAAKLMLIRPSYQEKGETLFYEIGFGAFRLQIMGSLGLLPDVHYPAGADVLVLPFQGRSDLTDYAFPFVERLAPKAVLLDHYDDAFPPLTTAIDTSEFTTIVKKRLNIPCRALTKFERSCLTEVERSCTVKGEV